jgi:ribonuclease D
LRAELLRYAALDVCVLPMMLEMLSDRLEKLGRAEWLNEDCARLVAAAREPSPPSQAWQRIRGIERLDGPSLVVLRALATWREKEARKKNRPRGFIIPDPVLLAMARRKPRKTSELECFGDLHPRARQRYGAAVVELIAHALDNGKPMEALAQVGRSEQAQLSKLRARAAAIAESLGVDPALLATRKELEQLVLKRALPERLRGWRRNVIGDELLALVKTA